MAYSPEDRAVLRARPTSGAWTSGTRRSPTRRVRPISAPASPSSRSTTTISARCARSTRRPARSCGKYKNRAPLWGGVLTTAGNLVFYGTPEGYLKAVDAKTGEVLWKFNTGSGVVGSADHLGAGRRAVCRRRLRLGRRRAAVGRRRRQEGQGHQPGRHGLGLQAAEDLNAGGCFLPVNCDKERGRFQPAPFRYRNPAFVTSSILHRNGTRRTLPTGKRRYNGPKKPPCARF